jgi:hypothetical protein
MIHHINQKQIIQNRIKITLDTGGGTYILVLEKNTQGNTIDKWVETEEGSCINNTTLLKELIEQFNLDTQPKSSHIVKP